MLKFRSRSRFRGFGLESKRSRVISVWRPKFSSRESVFCLGLECLVSFASVICTHLLLPVPSHQRTPERSGEAYLSLSSDDPILASFRLRRELLQVANEEKYYTASCNKTNLEQLMPAYVKFLRRTFSCFKRCSQL